jgi:hypothetical protein
VVAFPSAWIQLFGVNLVSAFPPDLGARFRYHERLRPQPSFSAIVHRFLSEDTDFTPHHVGEMVRVVTHEGEYGAWARIDGQRDGRHAVHFVGAVFMDDFATALDCIAILPDNFANVEQLSLELLRGETLQMTQRPRRFFYVPPVGWQAIPSGMTANWYPLDFPNNLSNISVPPATFLEIDPSRAIESAFAEVGAGLTVENVVRDELTSASGVKGSTIRIQGRRAGKPEPLYLELAMFVVASRAYRIRLETSNAAKLLELREVFRGVAGSFRPLPTAEEMRSGRAFSTPSNPFDHWAS